MTSCQQFGPRAIMFPPLSVHQLTETYMSIHQSQVHLCDWSYIN